MPIQLLALGPCLGCNAVQRIRHVRAHVVVPVLVQAERAARVLHEQVQQPHLELPDLGHRADDVVGDEVGAARPRREGELLLRPRHCWRWWWGSGAGAGAGVVGVGEIGKWEGDYVVEGAGEEG